MHQTLHRKEHAAFFHIGGDDRVGFFHDQTGIFAGILRVAALIIDRDHHLRTVGEAGLIVNVAETGRGVHAAGAVLGGDVIRQHQQGCLGQERMIGQHVLKEAAGVGLHDLIFGNAALFHDRFHKVFGKDIALTVGSLHDGVTDVRMQRDADVAGQRPGRGGPDQEEELFLVQMTQLAQIIVDGELHVNRIDRILVIFDLRLGESGLVVIAPVNRLEALVDMPVAVHLSEDAHLIRLKALVHGGVVMLPVAQNTEPLEAIHLTMNVLVGIGLAGGTEISYAHGLVVELLLLNDGALNGHTVVVPSGNIRHMVSAHHIAAVDEVLQGLVQGMAHMNVAIGEGRAIMQVEEGQAFALFQMLVIDVQFFPALQHVRLALRQTGAHGEIGFGQIKRGIIVFCHKYFYS